MKILPIALAATLAFSSSAPAWGPTGHRVTGEIAERFLTVEAKEAITAILGAEGLAEASVWPDEMRSSPEHFWKKVATPYHYVTIPAGKTYDDVGAPPQGDAVYAIEKFRAQLKSDKTSKKEKQLALRFIVHLVGDLHQPLHSGNGTDRGGNDVKLKYFWEDTNLHRVWDSNMIDGEKLSYTEWSNWLGAKITPEQVETWSDPNPRTWIAESVVLRDTIYPSGTELGYDYKFKHIPIVKRRLSMAGVRMAAVFNDIFQ